MKALAFENVGPTRMWDFNPGDPMRYVGEFDIEPARDTDGSFDPLATSERLWVVGNKEGADAAGKDWPQTRRSMCVGDLVVLIRPVGTPKMVPLVVDHVGFRLLTADESLDSLMSAAGLDEDGLALDRDLRS